MAYLSYDTTGQWYCGTVGEIRPRSVHCKAAVTTEPLEAVTWSFPSGSAHNLVFQLTSSWPDLRPNTFLIHRLLILQSHTRYIQYRCAEVRGRSHTTSTDVDIFTTLQYGFLRQQIHCKFPREGLLGHGPTAQRGPRQLAVQ